ncbi:MAG: pyruvate kinase [Chlamydiota bacterium]
MKQTKIICTLGPAVDSLQKIEELLLSGMNIARFNFSHGTYEEHAKRIKWVKSARKSLGLSCPLMLDTKGPEIRIGILEQEKKVESGEIIALVERAKASNELPMDPISVISSIDVGMTILFHDGYLAGTVMAKEPGRLLVKMIDAGALASRKGINVPDAKLNLPALTKRDREDLIFGCKMGIEIVAASFIRSSEHVLAIKQLLAAQGRPEVFVVAKIENRQGIEEFDRIVQVSDGIMVARGDLGVELDPSLVPKLQKMMVRKCFDACKPVTIATQMLESMIVNPRATRAEVSDVANAIYEGASSIMLSGESSVGKYPIEAVQLMKKIAQDVEEDFDNREFYYLHSRKEFPNISSAVALSSVKTAYTLGANMIFVFTTSGLTARLVSRFKPEMPVIAVTHDPTIFQQLGCFWGVIPLLAKSATWQNFFETASQYAIREEILSFGDLVVVIAGAEFGLRGSTNTMTVESIGSILARGESGYGAVVQGRVKRFVLRGNTDSYEDAILVLPACDSSYLPMMQNARGVILESHADDHSSCTYALEAARLHHLSIIVRAENALSILQEGEEIAMDPAKAIVYRRQSR